MDLARAFPPFGLRVVCGDLELRLPDDAELFRLADVALAGIHPPERSPFVFPWNVGEPDVVRVISCSTTGRRAASCRSSWALELAVFRDGDPIGVQSVNATDFGVTRSAGTGSWLGLVHHGQGIGKRMRLMALHLLFHGFDAVDARTEAFDDNPESNGVTRSLGYAPNGVGMVGRKGEAATENRYRMTREMWDARPAVHRPGRHGGGRGAGAGDAEDGSRAVAAGRRSLLSRGSAGFSAVGQPQIVSVYWGP